MPLFKKKFRDTKVGSFLKEKAPHILDTLDDAFPKLKIITALISNDEKLTPEQKAEAMELIKLEYDFEGEITERWKADANSDSWLSKNARPLVLLSSVLMLYVFMSLDSANIKFEIKPDWIDLYKVMLVAAIGGYFSMRTWEKIKRK